jgi:2-oxoisovalerate dehydrogenase E1 component
MAAAGPSAVSRTTVVDRQFRARVAALVGPERRTDLDSPVRPGAELTARQALALFDAQLESRFCDYQARELKNRGQSFYTIGSSGHEGNAAVAGASRPEDPAFLHYRSGAFFLARAQQVGGVSGAFDVLLGCCSSIDEPIAGGRHKVFGSVPLHIPPQTSTIASHLPKAVGHALALERRAHLEGRREERVVLCSFGDASANHATATAAFNTAAWVTTQHLPCPIVFVCEDNGIGISVRTPEGWIQQAFEHRAGLAYVQGDGLDLADAYRAATSAIRYAREHRRPVFLHLRTVRLLGHAGSDVEQLYRDPSEIEATEALDPLIATARILVEGGWCSPEDILTWYDNTQQRIRALADEAARRPRLTRAEEVVAPLFRHDPAAIATAVPVAETGERTRIFGDDLPETATRPRPLAFQINRALHDILAGDPHALLFGEDVARKGGVYHVTVDLRARFGVGRVFNTLLDETSILGLAIGAAHAGLTPLPEIQYLAYLMNAIDQLRGEAGSLQYFSNGQYQNGMVVRVAGLAYQKGFGGHFHNDNGIAAVREIPGILLGVPARGDDAARMLRTMVGAARANGRVCVFLEPIALYHTKDLHHDGDNAWLTLYPEPASHLDIHEVGVYGDGTDLCIATYGNGLWMSLRVAHRLHGEGYRCRVIDLRWLQPLPLGSLAPHAAACGRVLVVDECRTSSGIADTVVADLHERFLGRVHARRVTGLDTYIPLGAAADLVLVGEGDIERHARAMLETR